MVILVSTTHFDVYIMFFFFGTERVLGEGFSENPYWERFSDCWYAKSTQFAWQESVDINKPTGNKKCKIPPSWCRINRARYRNQPPLFGATKRTRLFCSVFEGFFWVNRKKVFLITHPWRRKTPYFRGYLAEKYRLIKKWSGNRQKKYLQYKFQKANLINQYT